MNSLTASDLAKHAALVHLFAVPSKSFTMYHDSAIASLCACACLLYEEMNDGGTPPSATHPRACKAR